MRAGRIIAYPFLAASYPVLALAAQNAGELGGLGDLAEPLAVSLAVAGVAWLAVGRATADPHRRGVLTLGVVLVFALFAPIESAVESWLGTGVGKAAASAAPVVALVLGLAVVAGVGLAVVPSPRDFRPLSRYLNATATLLLLFPIGALGRDQILSPTPPLARRLAASPSPAGVRRPDVYIVILDEYTGAWSLAANYGHDNGPFEDGLRRRGFVVPRASRSNYVWTFLSLASMLNWQYLDEVATNAGSGDHDPRQVFALIREHRTWQLLESLGYRFVFFPTAFAFTASSPHAHVHLPDPRQVTAEFVGVWRQGTPITSLSRWACQVVGCAQQFLPYTPETARLVEWKFEQLGSLPRTGAPLFVFAHLPVPHEPFIFRADCTRRRPFWPSFEGGATAEEVRRAYVEQTRCVNRKLEVLVDRLLARSPDNPPLIIFQSDHGYAFMGRRVPGLDEVTPAAVDERTDIFAAYRLPDGDRGAIYDGITPVNAFRAIFGRTFGLDLPPLEDRTYWSSFPRTLEFTRVY